MITSSDISTCEVHVLKSAYLGELGEPYERNGEVLLRDAVLASCAAPMYFDPKSIGPYLLADGGLWADNLSIIALTEALSAFKKPVERTRVLSIDTGYTKNMFSNRGPWGLLTGWGREKLVSYTLALQSQASSNMAKLILRDRYLQLDPQVDTRELDDTKHLHNLKALADKDFMHNLQRNPGTYRKGRLVRYPGKFNAFLAREVKLNERRRDLVREHLDMRIVYGMTGLRR